MRLLVVEDDPGMGAAMVRGVRDAGVIADIAPDADEALWMVRAAPFDVIVLDLGLPDIDGIELCRMLRADGIGTPIIMVTARDGVDDRVTGLDAGADDYLTKPFSIAELLARMRAVGRRGADVRRVTITVGSLTLDPAAGQAARGEHRIDLTSRELALLETFMRQPGQVLSQHQLLGAAWDLGYEHRSNVVEVYVRYLREKIDRPFGVQSIETVRGIGYRLRSDGGG